MRNKRKILAHFRVYCLIVVCALLRTPEQIAALVQYVLLLFSVRAVQKKLIQRAEE